jgi:hypothetical protein
MGLIKRTAPALFIALLVAGCDLAQGIFKGGFIIGIIVAVIIVGILFKMFSGKGGAA